MLDRFHRALLTSPAVTIPVFSGGHVAAVRIPAHDWTPTYQSRLAWLRQHYPSSTVEIESLNREHGVAA